ncbi:MAG: putative RNA-binding protein YlqC (UPF0109 family) [Myxococcota bacterium]|jgi:predicted RNA-binding protein YlqC (UPF0109 family)
MEALVEYLGKSLVSHPDDVSVSLKESDRGDVHELSVNSDDLGQVIGRQGRTARAIRAVSRAAGSREGIRVQVEIVE